MGKERTSSYSIWSLIMGILSMISSFLIIGVVLGIIGIVLSRKATKDIETNDIGGRGLATSGLICSIVGLSIFIILLILGVLLIGLRSVA